MQIKGSVALVTGANRGIGKAFVRALLDGGAKKVYAAARNPEHVESLPGVVPIKLDVTNAADIAAVAVQATDVTLLINNAGIGSANAVSQAISIDASALRREIEVNAIGPLEMSLAFAPILAANGGGGIVNILSALSWINLPSTVTYSASKAAAWSITNGLRLLLADQGTVVTGVHVAFVDTDMTSGIDGVPKAAPQDVATKVLQGVEQGEAEVLVDGISTQIKESLSAGVYLQPVPAV